MKYRSKCCIRGAGLLLAFLLLFTNCTLPAQAAVSQQPSLWVVAEKLPADGETDALQDIVDIFHQQHPNVSVRIEYIPTEANARTEYISAIRNAIRNGNGPDVYLLPTRDVLLLNEPKQYTYQRVEMLFPDVALAMRNGVFYDLSKLYDYDSTLDKETLQPDVMDAGIIAGKRYVLPLEYRQSVIYAFPTLLEQYGLSTSDLDQPFIQWIKTALTAREQSLACCAEHIDFSLFSELIDYENGKVSLSIQELAEYLSLYHKVLNAVGEETAHRSNVTLEAYTTGKWVQYPANLYSISCAPTFAAIASIEKERVEMVPLYTNTYQTSATVAYYGAIGANCSSPELAYQLLRLFLTEAGQEKFFLSTLHDQAWPVRWKQAVTWSWEESLAFAKAFFPKKNSIPNHLTITAENLPILDQEIDIVRFPLASPNILGQYASEIEKCSTVTDYRELAGKILTSLSDSLSQTTE